MTRCKRCTSRKRRRSRSSLSCSRRARRRSTAGAGRSTTPVARRPEGARTRDRGRPARVIPRVQRARRRATSCAGARTLPATTTATRPKSSLIGKRGAWFGHIATDRIGGHEELESVLTDPLRRAAPSRRAAAGQADQAAHLARQGDRLSHQQATGRRPPRGAGPAELRTLQQSVESDDQLGEERRRILAAMRSVLDYQSACLRQREHAFVRDDTSGRRVTLRWDRQRDDRRVQSDPLLVALDGRRPTFGEFLTSDDAWTGRLPPDARRRRGSACGHPGRRRHRRRMGRRWRVARRARRGSAHPGERLAATGRQRAERQRAAPPEHGVGRSALSARAARAARSSRSRSAGRARPGRTSAAARSCAETARRSPAECSSTVRSSRCTGRPGPASRRSYRSRSKAYLRREPSHRILVAAQANDALDKLAEKVLAWCRPKGRAPSWRCGSARSGRSGRTCRRRPSAGPVTETDRSATSATASTTS